MNSLQTTPSNPPDRRERWVIILVGFILSALVLWGVVANYLFRFAYVVGGFCLLLIAVLVTVAWRKGLRWLAGRRALPFYSWLIAGILSFIVLFYAEEKWRGQRAWVALQREAAARGESLELASVIPAPVPDDQNFATAPGVASVLRFASAETGLEKVKQQSAFYHGDADDWPQANFTRQQFTDFQQWQSFLSSLPPLKFAGNNPPVPSQGPATNAAAAVLEILGQFDASLAPLRAAADRPLARYPIDYTTGWGALNDRLYQLLLDLRYATHALALRASALLALGHADAALDDLQLALRLADTLRHEPFMTAQSCRSRMIMYALQSAWEGLANHQWNDAQLQVLQQRFSALDTRDAALRGARGETILTLDMASQLEAYLQGRQSSLARKLSEKKGADAFGVWLFQTFYPSGWLAQDRVWVYRFYDEHARENWLTAEPRLKQKTWKCELLQAMDPLLLIWVVPRVKQVCEDSVEWGLYLEALSRQAATACALERFWLAQGHHYPDSLRQLIPSQLEHLPADELAPSAKAMSYRLLEPGRFILYSVGLNKSDDGGDPMPFRGCFSPRFSQGDWVWSYPAAGAEAGK